MEKTKPKIVVTPTSFRYSEDRNPFEFLLCDSRVE